MKMLLPLVLLQLLVAPALTALGVDHWDTWGPYGECSRSCGSGVTMRTRRCITHRTDGGHNCVGPDKSYRSCNIQDCPEGSKDFREEQCSQFDGTDFQGKLYKWLPYYGAENPCELNCMPRGENFFYRHRSSVVDGTPCHPGRRDVCVDGVCKRLGCDNMLESPQQEDPCLQCGGNGQSCYRVKNSFSVRDLPTGYNQMFIIPVGATTISIRETVATRNYLAIKNLRGEYYLNGHWVIEFSRATPIAGTMLYYQRGAEGDNVPESIVGRGPTTEPLVVELISQEPNQGVEYEFYLPNGRSREGYYWSFGSWSTCSRECGSGYQSRLVFCTIDNEAYPDYLCASLPRPQSNRTCNPHSCPQIRSWRTGKWNTCSVTCGGGSQVRRVECVSHDASGPRVVEDAVCAAYAEAPPALQTCHMHMCTEYRATRWSACSVTCGSGEQTRDVTCVGSGGMRLEETSCSTLLRPIAVRPCEKVACLKQISWHVGEWGLCSRSCGSGSRERQVICSDRERNLYPVDQCNSNPKPKTVERCNPQPCYSPQVVPSVQDSRGHDNTQTVFQPYVPDHATALRPETDPTQTNTVHGPHSSAPALHCSQSYYGCCPDGRTSAGGPKGLGCPRAPAPSPVQPSCIQTSYGCCQDGVTAAQGPNKEGCIQYVEPAPTAAPSIPTENAVQCRTTTYGCCYDRTTPAEGPNGEGCPNPPNHIERSICSLPRAAGSCSHWVPRYHYDVITSKCVQFWYGSCHGNSNNFMTRAECQRVCQVAAPSQQGPGPVAPAGEPTPRRESAPGGTAAGGGSRAGGSTSGGSTGGGSHNMGRIFTVQGGSTSGTGRQATSAATHAHRARVHLRFRRPSPATAAQHTGPAASYGCCQDGVTAAQGPNKEGCIQYVEPAPTAAPSIPTENAVQCRTTTYGCCYDRTTPAEGPNGEGCPNPPNHIERSICSLPRAAGSCSHWVPRYHYDVITSKCVQFWYGSCHGNSNNFMTRAECQRVCQVAAPSQQGPGPVAPAGEPTPRRESAPGGTAAGGGSRAGGSTSGGSTGGGSHNMGRIFTVQGGSTSGTGRQATSAATHAHRARVHLRFRRPSPATAAQHTGPAASYGCCQDGVTAAQGPNKEGCIQYVEPAPTAAPSIPTENAVQCRTTTYGCCYDRTTPAEGPNGEGCPNPPNHIERSICSLPRAAGSCSHWVPRYHYDVITSKCVQFWYGSCHGNSNNFMTRAECQRVCQVAAPSQQGPGPVAPAGEPTPRRESAPGGTAAGGGSRAGGSTSGGSTGGGSHNMGRIFTVQGGSTSGTGRQATSAATHAHRARVHLRFRRPSPATAAQHTGPAASLTLGEVTINKADPSTVEALVGQTVVLPCRVSPPPSSTVIVEWRRDGSPLSTHRHHQQPNGSLLVGPLTKLDSGWFLCVVTREQERDHRYIYLSVTEGSVQLSPTSLPRDGPFPRFSIERSGSSLLEMRAGQTARLSCRIVPPSALQSVNIQWTKDGQTIGDSRYTTHSDGTLIVGPLRSEDSGLYTCTASTQQQLEQRQLQLRVQADLRITTAPNNIQVSEGSTALLPCVVSGDNVNIGWSRNGVPVRSDGRNILMTSDGSLILNNVKPSDEGTYTCNAYTGIYSVSATAEVRVTKDTQQGADVPPECVDQPELANCELIVYARLCSNSYYSSFCCASCTRHSQRNDRFGRLG